VVQIRRLRVACRYNSALRLVPDTVRSLHALLAGKQWRKAARLLVLTEEAAASIVRYVGHAQASAIIAERMRQLACRAEEPILVSLAAFQRSHAFSACGATGYARTVAASAVETTRPYADRKGGQQLLGMLMLTASVTCIASRRSDDALTYLSEAKRIADRTGDSDVLSLHFGPTNIRIWELSMEVDKGDPARAVAGARQQGPVKIAQVQRQATYHIDMGRALWHTGRDDEALQELMDAERLAPAHVRADKRVRRTVRNIVERRVDVPASVLAFSQRLEVT
jgi:hypothetical protein